MNSEEDLTEIPQKSDISFKPYFEDTSVSQFLDRCTIIKLNQPSYQFASNPFSFSISLSLAMLDYCYGVFALIYKYNFDKGLDSQWKQMKDGNGRGTKEATDACFNILCVEIPAYEYLKFRYTKCSGYMLTSNKNRYKKDEDLFATSYGRPTIKFQAIHRDGLKDTTKIPQMKYDFIFCRPQDLKFIKSNINDRTYIFVFNTLGEGVLGNTFENHELHTISLPFIIGNIYILSPNIYSRKPLLKIIDDDMSFRAQDISPRILQSDQPRFILEMIKNSIFSSFRNLVIDSSFLPIFDQLKSSFVDVRIYNTDPRMLEEIRKVAGNIIVETLIPNTDIKTLFVVRHVQGQNINSLLNIIILEADTARLIIDGKEYPLPVISDRIINNQTMLGLLWLPSIM